MNAAKMKLPGCAWVRPPPACPTRMATEMMA